MTEDQVTEKVQEILKSKKIKLSVLCGRFIIYTDNVEGSIELGLGYVSRVSDSDIHMSVSYVQGTSPMIHYKVSSEDRKLILNKFCSLLKKYVK